LTTPREVVQPETLNGMDRKASGKPARISGGCTIDGSTRSIGPACGSSKARVSAARAEMLRKVTEGCDQADGSRPQVGISPATHPPGVRASVAKRMNAAAMPGTGHDNLPPSGAGPSG
jgi:hypothetical protein